jgi:hypothetical protein
VGPGTVGIYPNPVTGPVVNILPAPYAAVSGVRVEVFTVAFRKVVDETFQPVPSGTPLSLALTDRGGNRLSNGLYYVVVTTRGGKALGKLLVLR